MKTLIVQTAFLGDLVLSTPVYDAVKELHPESDLHLLTTSGGAQLFKQDTRFSHVSVFEKRERLLGIKSLLQMGRVLKRESYDRVYSLHRSFRTALLLRLAGIKNRIGFSDASGSFLYTSRSQKLRSEHAVTRFLSLLHNEWIESGREIERLYDWKLTLCPGPHIDKEFHNAVVLVPGSAWKTKQWHWSEYRKLALQLVERGERVVLAGSKEERELCERVRGGGDCMSNSAGDLSLGEFMSLIQGARALVCNDSLALHIGSAFGIPTVSVFCATSPTFGFGPWRNPRSVVVEKQGLWCKPCRRHGSKVCPTGSEHCMRGVSANEVLFQLDRLTKGDTLYQRSHGPHQLSERVLPSGPGEAAV